VNEMEAGMGVEAGGGSGARRPARGPRPAAAAGEDGRRGGGRACLRGRRRLDPIWVRSGGRSEWVPRFREWRRGSLYRGDGEEFLVHGEKKGRG
jgi:hypothetical protein